MTCSSASLMHESCCFVISRYGMTRSGLWRNGANPSSVHMSVTSSVSM